MNRLIILGVASILVLGACGGQSSYSEAKPIPTVVERLTTEGENTEPPTVVAESSSEDGVKSETLNDAQEQTQAGVNAAPARGMGMGMGSDAGRAGGLRGFHSAPIPAEYAGTLSPVHADADSVARGEPLYQTNCAVCHGETGLGDGPTAAALTPAPPMIAMTSQMLGDDYMLWRISEGGAFEPYMSAMPAWKSVLDEDQRWDVVNYVRSLGGSHMMHMGGQGPEMGGMGMGGPGMNADMEAVMRAEMLAAALELGAITQEQAEMFDNVHSKIDALRAADPKRQFAGTMRDLQDELLSELVTDGIVSQADADIFYQVHDTLESSGLMQ